MKHSQLQIGICEDVIIDMKRYIALLRGINISGKNKIPMPELKAYFTELGYIDVHTYLNSGNVAFSVDENNENTLSNSIKDMIQKRFGLDIPVFVILQEKLEDILSKAPDWWGTSDKDIYDNLIFVMSPATAEIIAEKIGEPTKELEQICICDNTIFGLLTGINIVDLVNPEKLFFIGNRNFQSCGEIESNRRFEVV